MSIQTLMLCLLQFLCFFSFVLAIPTEPLRSYVDCSKYGSPHVSSRIFTFSNSSSIISIVLGIRTQACLSAVLTTADFHLNIIFIYSGYHSKWKMFLRSLRLANLSRSTPFCAEWVSKRSWSVKSTSSCTRSRYCTIQIWDYGFNMEWTFRKRRIHLYLLLVFIAVRPI